LLARLPLGFDPRSGKGGARGRIVTARARRHSFQPGARIIDFAISHETGIDPSQGAVCRHRVALAQGEVEPKTGDVSRRGWIFAHDGSRISSTVRPAAAFSAGSSTAPRNRQGRHPTCALNGSAQTRANRNGCR
jgi:hypothetical protein